MAGCLGNCDHDGPVIPEKCLQWRAGRPYDLNNAVEVPSAKRRNRAITDCYEPGSTFKIIVGTAALEEGIVSPVIHDLIAVPAIWR